MEELAAKEVRRYIYVRTDDLLAVEGVTSLPGSGDLILVANDDNPMVESLRGLINHSTNPQGFIIKTVNSGGRDILVITGNDSAATLHGAYRYAEHLGVGFDLAGDAIPDAKISLDITGLDEVGEPLFEINGFLPFHDFFHGPDIWSTSDYKSFISQISKLGMNFIGLHTYPTWSTTEEKTLDERQGPEPNVWIGLQGDYDENGDVSWSYPGYYRHTADPTRSWAHEALDTDEFGSGTSQLFDRNEWGSDIFGSTMPAPGNMSAWNEVWNRSGAMFKESFGYAKNIGVKTCLGTELTMGLEPSGPEVGYDWARVMPPALQSRLSDPYDPGTVRSVYKGVFERIMKTHDLDYYWLWSWEVWTRWGVSAEQIQAFKDDLLRADEALDELGRPFQICHAGWILGTGDNPAEFDDTLAPEAPFHGLWDQADGFEDLKSSRVKWPATWLEEDWGLGQPQLEASRIYVDVKAAWNKDCDGMIAKHWRTKALLANPVSMKDILWCYGPTGTPVNKSIPSSRSNWIDGVYLDWATRQFGPEAASSIASILAPIDNAGEGAVPSILEWEGPPGAIVPNSANWSSYQSNFTFVDDLVALRPQIVGAGNQGRYEYLLDTLESFKLMAEYGCVRDDYMNALDSSNWSTALNHRRSMARLFEQFQTMFIERIVNVTDLGAIIHHEIVNWYQLVEQLTDSDLGSGLGGSIPSDANPTSSYLGSAFVKVVPVETHVEKGEDLTLKVLIMDSPTSAILYYRPLGSGSYSSISLTHVARGVYEVTIPAQQDDYEYYIYAETPIGNATFPVTSPSINQTVVVSTLGDQSDCPVGDLDGNCYVNVNDLGLFAIQWLDDPCCPNHPIDCADLDGEDDGVNFEDYSYLGANWLQPERDPPEPSPATWAIPPTALGPELITMTATTGFDLSEPLEYYFDETSGNPGGSISGWQSDSTFTDVGLIPGTEYTYTVQMRDSLHNYGLISVPASASTDPDTVAPLPNPATFSSVPAAISDSAISMTATAGSDISVPVEDFFDETSGNSGGSDSGWQSLRTYTDTGLDSDTQYTYTVTLRDGAYNEGSPSDPESATTLTSGSGPIGIVNFSFEQPGTGEEITNFSQIPGWDGPSGDDTGINSFDGSSEGSWCISLGPNDGFVSQLTSHTIIEGVYQLQIDAKDEGNLQLQLYYGSTTLATQSFSISGGYSTKTLTTTVSSGNPGIGHTIGVRFKNTQSDSWTVADNVRLTLNP
jgi:hypothetical protein